MSKIVWIAGALVAAFALTPALAADMKCDDAAMKEMNTKAMAMKDEKMKKMAMDEMTMAMDSMKAKKMDDCMMHMNNAAKSMM